jgi:endonuclease G
MAPADDYRFSTDAEHSTFVLSNAVPQSPSVNRGRWHVIESEVEQLAASHGNLWVISGPLFLDAAGQPTVPTRFIGQSRVAVPTHVFKVVLCVHQDGTLETFAFVVPNTQGVLPGPSSRYLVSVAEVQRLAGLDFFAPLDDATELRLEAYRATVWPVRQ